MRIAEAPQPPDDLSVTPPDGFDSHPPNPRLFGAGRFHLNCAPRNRALLCQPPQCSCRAVPYRRKPPPLLRAAHSLCLSQEVGDFVTKIHIVDFGFLFASYLECVLLAIEWTLEKTFVLGTKLVYCSYRPAQFAMPAV